MEKQVYIAKVYDSKEIHVTHHKIVDETEKQVKLENGKKVNKSYIGKCTKSEVSYAYSQDEAVNVLKNFLALEKNQAQTMVNMYDAIITSEVKLIEE